MRSRAGALRPRAFAAFAAFAASAAFAAFAASAASMASLLASFSLSLASARAEAKDKEKEANKLAIEAAEAAKAAKAAEAAKAAKAAKARGRKAPARDLIHPALLDTDACLYANKQDRGIKVAECVHPDYSEIEDHAGANKDHLLDQLAQLELRFMGNPTYQHEIYFRGQFKCPGQPGRHSGMAKVTAVEAMVGKRALPKFLYRFTVVWEDAAQPRACQCDKDAFIKSVMYTW